MDPATAGTVTGAITFRGAKPAPQAISMESDAGCQKANAGKKVYDDAVVTGKTGGLANAFVYIQSGLEGKKFEPADEPVVLDQHGCMFAPRVIGIRAGADPGFEERRRGLAQRPSDAGQQSRMEPGAAAAGARRAAPLRARRKS